MRSIKKRWDSQDNAQLRSHGGNLAAVLLRLERDDIRRFEMTCNHIGRVLPDFDRFELDESNGTVLLRWKAKRTDKTLGVASQPGMPNPGKQSCHGAPRSDAW